MIATVYKPVGCRASRRICFYGVSKCELASLISHKYCHYDPNINCECCINLIYPLELSIFRDMASLPPLTELAAPVYFFSDAHLGAVLIPDAKEQEARLDRFLDMVAANGRTLVLAGDLFDFWYEWKYVIPKQPFRVLCRMRHLVEQGIAVHYLAGNHDFRLRGFLESGVGMQIHADTLSARICGQPIFIYHGDGVLARDHGYRLLKSILRNLTAQRIFSWLHPDFAMRLARGTSVTSRTIIKSNPRDDLEYLARARTLFAEGYQGVVMGHTHRPVEHAEDGHTYVNLGDWILHYTFGLHDGTRLSLQRLGE
jgi:UDP-2,3-diacylglucosamine hydrolase